MSYVPLHLHTHYSLLDGYGTPNRYMEYAAKLKLPAAAVTDHGSVMGIMDWYEAGQENGIKALLGQEFYQARKTRFDLDEEERAGKVIDELEQRGPYHLTVIARNKVGYKNLIKLSSRAFLEGFYVKPRIDHQLLAEHAEGLMVLSGCLNGEVNQALLRNDLEFATKAAAAMQDMVGKENYYIEVQDHGLPEQKRVLEDCLIIANKIGAKVVATGDCHYVHQDDAESHDLLLCLSTGATQSQEQRFRFFGPEFYLKSYQEMAYTFPEEWLSNTVLAAESVDLDLKFGELYFPKFPLPEGRRVDEYLEESVWNGLKIKYGIDLPDDVVAQAKYELAVIKQMEFQEYFLVVADLIAFARQSNIRTGVGRGSAASSIVSYALNITGLDPLRFNLLFERFLMPGRKSMPDIDLDFDDRYRDKMIEYARNKYGVDHLANICTFSKLGARSTIRDIARVMDYDYLTGDKLAKLVPPPIQGFAPTIEDALSSSADFRKAYEQDNDARKIIDSAKSIEGLIRQTGIHAAGIVISRGPIIDYIPVMQKGQGKPVVTQWNDDWVEMNGKLKIDFLGLRNLSIIDIAIANIHKRHGKYIDTAKIPLDDAVVYASLSSGDTSGVFQLESGGMREMTKAIQPDCIEHIMAIIALYRPGPLGSNMHTSFIARKNGREKVSYAHPLLAEEPIFKNYYGIMLYQESLLIAAKKLAGFDEGEADDLRKAVGKKLKDKIKLFRESFVEGCAKTNNIPAIAANKVFSDIEYFGAYGFNVAHSASYALIAWWTAWLKHHYPVEYMAGLLTSVSDDSDKMSFYLNECRRMGIKVYPPSINSSTEEFKVLSDNEILYGISAIKGIGIAASSAIFSSRTEHPYTSIYDFMRRVDTPVLDKTIIESLIESGALDELVPTQKKRLMSQEEKMELLAIEKARLGLYVSDHPLTSVWPYLEPNVTHTVVDLEGVTAGALVTLGGMVTKAERKITKRGDAMYRLTLEDMVGSLEVIVFPRETKRFGALLEEGVFCLVEGRVEKEGDDENPTSKLILSNFTIPQIDRYIGEAITLGFPEPPGIAIIEKVGRLIELTPGDSPVFIEFEKFGHLITLKMKKPTSIDIKEDLQLLTLKERTGL